MPRFYVPTPLAPGQSINLPFGAMRHAQVLRLQPGDGITLFNGKGGEWTARVGHMGKSTVTVQALAHQAVEREVTRAIHLAVSWVATERMDWLVEKAVELGAVSLTPIVTARTQQRLMGERADRKCAHWQAVAIAACEQCGRNRLMTIHAPLSLNAALQSPVAADTSARWLLSMAIDAVPLHAALRTLSLPGASVTLLSGPEGGLTTEEQAAAQAAGWQPVVLGTRTLRAETAPLATLAVLTAL